jgi:HAD superfamily hydrolase (TIGR01459 family)
MLRHFSQSHAVWFCDIWGVVHDGVKPYPHTVDSLQRHRKRGGAVVLVSNSPRTTIGVSKQLDEIGVPRDAYDTAVTSGDVTRSLMQVHGGRKLYHLGPDRDQSIFAGLGVERVSVAEANAVISTGLFHDDVETPADYVELLAEIKARNLSFICANPDKIVRIAGNIKYCAGALAEAYAALGGEVLMAGKPFAPIYDLALAEAKRICGRDIDRMEILAIGDGPETDIQGATEQRFDCIFVTGLADNNGLSLEAEDLAIKARFPDTAILATVHDVKW